MMTDLEPNLSPERSQRTIELMLARVHLRLGLLALARTELETAADRGEIDPDGLIDLAEVRWRSGDLVVAGQAAAQAIAAGVQDPVAFVVASEAASADGRPTEARRFGSLATAIEPAVDRIFAGMPRSTTWAPDVYEPLPVAATLFDRVVEHRPPAVGPVDDAGPSSPPVTDPGGPAPMTLGLWAGDETADPAVTLPEPAEEFDAGRAALVDGAFDEAAFHLGLALRLAPALAPAVLEITDGSRARSLFLTRGDAYRSAGHESEARQAFAIAAQGGLPERRSHVRAKALLSTSDALAVLLAGPISATPAAGPESIDGADAAQRSVAPDQAEAAEDPVSTDAESSEDTQPDVVPSEDAPVDADDELDTGPLAGLEPAGSGADDQIPAEESESGPDFGGDADLEAGDERDG